jgi:glyoxylase-like metal-dependent hydrolase (beta-lactamase superfamily II)
MQGTEQILEKNLQIGPYQIKPVPTGEFGLDGGAMFGTVPKALWEKSNPADAQNRIPMEARALLLLGDKHKILIDCGIGGDFVEKYGEKLGPKFAEIYAMDRTSTSLELSLKKWGLGVADITDVILTHLHFDHAGGATTFRDGKLQPTFPNARYYVQKENLQTASNPNLRERASYYAANFQPLLDAGVLKILDGEVDELLPGISVQISHGHTQGQQMVKVTDGTNTLVYCGDVIPTSSHVRLPWVMGYDLRPLDLIEEKRTLLTPAAQGHWYLFFEHDPYVDIATVTEVRGDFAIQEKLRLI